MTMSNTPVWTLAHIGLKFPGATAAIGTGVAAFMILAGDPTPMVAITFDDGFESTYTVAKPILDKHNLLASVYLTTDFIGTNHEPNKYMAENQIVDLVNAGWEIGAHSIQHANMTEVSENELINNLIYPVTHLAKISGQEIFSFASPYGAYNDRTLDRIEKVYFNHVNSFSDAKGLNTVETFDPYNVNRLDVTKDITAEYICETIQNLPDDSLYSIIFHDVTNETDDFWDTNVEKFETIVACIAEADVNSVRISDGIEAMVEKADD